jgi:hypothetical protein
MTWLQFLSQFSSSLNEFSQALEEVWGLTALRAAQKSCDILRASCVGNLAILAGSSRKESPVLYGTVNGGGQTSLWAALNQLAVSKPETQQLLAGQEKERSKE